MARHGSLAEQLSAMKAYIDRPEGDVEQVQTNWSTVAANDNNPEDYAEVHTERRVSVRPTIGEIFKNVKDGPVVRNNAGQIVSIGRLRFSDGAQVERCMMSGIDGEPIVGKIRMPTGALLGSKEEQERTLGGNGASAGESNAWFCKAFDVENRPYVAGGKRRKGRNYSRDEAAAMLAEALANTTEMPEVQQCEDGIALGSARIADNFIGMKKAAKGNGGSLAWQDLSDKIAEREMFMEAERQLTETDKAVLDAAKAAKSMSEIGSAIGFKGRSAFRHGRRALHAANDNMMQIISKLSA